MPWIGDPLTASAVRSTRFGRPTTGHRGYDPDEVDAFVERVAATMSGRGELTADQVRSVVFGPAIPRRGYDAGQVDAFLDRVEQQLRSAAAGQHAATRLRTGQDLLGVRLPKASRGYDPDEVDAFRARAAATLDGHSRAMTSTEVRHTRFSVATGLHRGYRPASVDALLDELEQELRSRGR